MNLIRTAFFLVLMFTPYTAFVAAGDAVLFQPITNTTSETKYIDKLPPADQWPGWCGVKIITKNQQVTTQKTTTQSYYTTTDGQRLAGIFELNNSKLSWRNSTFQSFLIDLENTQSIGPLFVGEQKKTQTDTIFLVNNDRLDGFIESMNATTGVSIEVTKPAINKDKAPEKETTRVSIERISEIQLATKVKKPSGWRFWLADGSIVDADSWSEVQDQCELKNPHIVSKMDVAIIAWSNILSMAPNASAVTSLANCPHKVITNSGAQEPRLSTPTTHIKIIPSAFDAAPIDLHGPGVFEFFVENVGQTLTMSLAVPPQLQSNVECRVTIECGGKTAVQELLRPGSNQIAIRVPIVENKILVRLDQSKRGAFGCAVRLLDAIIISDSCGAPSQPNHLQANVPAKSGL